MKLPLLFGVSFFKKIQGWIFKSEGIRKQIFVSLLKKINPRLVGSLCVKGTEESTLSKDSSVPLTHHLGLINFRILWMIRFQSWIKVRV